MASIRRASTSNYGCTLHQFAHHQSVLILISLCTTQPHNRPKYIYSSLRLTYMLYPQFHMSLDKLYTRRMQHTLWGERERGSVVQVGVYVRLRVLPKAVCRTTRKISCSVLRRVLNTSTIDNHLRVVRLLVGIVA